MPIKNQQYIIEAIKTGSYNKLDDFFEKLATQWKNCKFSNNKNIEDLEDIYQDAVVSLILRIRSKKSFDLCVYAYFMSICKNKLFDKIKKDKKIALFSVDPLADSDIDTEKEEKNYEIYRACFKKLPIDCRRLINMRFNKMSSKQIALKLGITPNNVDQKLYSCREALRKCIEKHL